MFEHLKHQRLLVGAEFSFHPEYYVWELTNRVSAKRSTTKVEK